MRISGFIMFSIFILFFIEACNLKSILLDQKPEPEIPVAKPELIAPQIEGMVYIPDANFQMGSNSKASEGPIHTVELDGYYIDKNEVTVYEFERFCKATRRRMPKQPNWSDDDHPVVNVTWNDANDFARWNDKRLPSEAEWEYAARSNQPGTAYAANPKQIYGRSFGNIADESMLRFKLRFPVKERYDDGYIYSAPVGSYPSNYFDINDLEGNVLEWCSDWYAENYYKNSPLKNPTGPDKGSYRIIRGASWNRSGEYLRATYRSWYPMSCAFEFLGFRCAKDFHKSGNNVAIEIK